MHCEACKSSGRCHLLYTGTWLYNLRPANGFANNWDVTLPISYGRYQHPAFVTMIFNSGYQHLAKSDVVVTKNLQIIYRPLYNDIVNVCSLVPHLSYTLVHQLPMRTIKPSLTIIARALSQYKHPYRSLPSPSWIMVTNWDLGNEFPFRHRDNVKNWKFFFLYSIINRIYILIVSRRPK